MNQLQPTIELSAVLSIGSPNIYYLRVLSNHATKLFAADNSIQSLGLIPIIDLIQVSSQGGDASNIFFQIKK